MKTRMKTLVDPRTNRDRIEVATKADLTSQINKGPINNIQKIRDNRKNSDNFNRERLNNSQEMSLVNL